MLLVNYSLNVLKPKGQVAIQVKQLKLVCLMAFECDTDVAIGFSALNIQNIIIKHTSQILSSSSLSMLTICTIIVVVRRHFIIIGNILMIVSTSCVSGFSCSKRWAVSTLSVRSVFSSSVTNISNSSSSFVEKTPQKSLFFLWSTWNSDLELVTTNK